MQKSINGLKAGTTYSIQVRSITPNETSEWSPVVEKYIPIPAITPNAPTNVTATGNPDNIKISWTQATLNTDNTSLSQPAYYQVYQSFTSPVSTTGNPVGKTSGSSFTYPTVVYDKTQYFVVKTVDGFRNFSTGSTEVSSKALTPTISNGLQSQISSYSRSTTGGTVTISTVADHGLIVGDSFHLLGSYGGVELGVDTQSNEPATVLSVTGTTGLTAITNQIGPAVNITAKSGSVTSATGDGTTVTYTVSGATFSTGNIVTISDISPRQYNISNAVVSSATGSNFSVIGSAQGTFISGGTVIQDLPAYLFPSDNAVRIKRDGIIIGNLSEGFTVIISPTSFQMQSASEGTRLVLTSDLIKTSKRISTSVGSLSDGTVLSGAGQSIYVGGTLDLYTLGFSPLVTSASPGKVILKKSNGTTYEIFYEGISEDGYSFLDCKNVTGAVLAEGDLIYEDFDTVSIDGSTGDATIVGKFSTGFSPDPRIEINSGFSEPEIITFFSGLPDEEEPAFIRSSLISNLPSSFGTAGTASNLVTIPGYTYVTNTTGNISMPLGNATLNVNSINNFPTAGGQFDLYISKPGLPSTWSSFVYSSATGNSFVGVTGGSNFTGYSYSDNAPVGCSVYFTYNSGWTGSELVSSGDMWVDKMGLLTTVTGPSVGYVLGTDDTSGGTAITVVSTTGPDTGTSGFPDSGSLLIYSSVFPTSDPELVTYTGKTDTSFLGVVGGGGSVTGGTVILDADSLSQISYGKIFPGGTEKTVTGPSPVTSGIRTITATSHSFNVGDRVIIYGFTGGNTAYNETAIVISTPTANTFTYKSTVTSGSPSSYTGAKARLFDSVRGVHIDSLNGLLDNTINVRDKVYIFPNRSEMTVSSAAVNKEYVNNGLSPSSGGGSSIDTSANFLPAFIKLKGTTVYNQKIVTEPTLDIRGNIRVLNAGDASLTGTSHAFQIGRTSSYNLIIDNNEIMARRNGTASGLILNAEGGFVSVNGSVVKGVVSGEGTTTAGGTATITHGLGGGVVPIVVCTVKAGAATTAEYSIYVTSATTTQFSVRSLSGNVASSVNFNWVAVAPL
jgi:hypothetical protein